MYGCAYPFLFGKGPSAGIDVGPPGESRVTHSIPLGVSADGSSRLRALAPAKARAYPVGCAGNDLLCSERFVYVDSRQAEGEHAAAAFARLVEDRTILRFRQTSCDGEAEARAGR